MHQTLARGVTDIAKRPDVRIWSPSHPGTRHIATVRQGRFGYPGPIDARQEEEAMAENSANPDLLGLTAEIVSAHVSNNPVAVADLPTLIQDVYRTLTHIGQPPPRRRNGRSRRCRSRSRSRPST
jgi:hypothetical protein